MDYSQHSFWSDPGEYRELLLELPEDLIELADALENFLIHHVAARSLGFGVPEYAETDRQSRTVARLMAKMMSRDDRSLSEHRDLPDYLYVVCRDFSLIAASVLRSRGIPARLRVGFVDYLVNDFWEDHWVCEYFLDGQWRLFDPQLGARARNGFGIQFAVNDVPRTCFKSGAEMWLDLRSGRIDSDDCGVSFVEGLRGDQVCAANLLRDAAALLKTEMLAWDFWGISGAFIEEQQIQAVELERLDQLANEIIDVEKYLPGTIQGQLSAMKWALPKDVVLSFVAGRLVEYKFTELYAGDR